MPPRLYAIVTCSCGAKYGDARRAEKDDFRLGEHAGTALERLALASKVPEMLRHWRLGHRMTGHGREWMSVIAHAAQEIAIKEGARP